MIAHSSGGSRRSLTVGGSPAETSIVGTYHHVSPKHAPSYLASFAYRFNRRRQLDSIVARLAWAAVRTAPHPCRVVIADV